MANLHVVLPPASETSLISEEPTWDGTVKNYNSEMLRGLNWHNYCASEKDLMKYMEQWIREMRPATAKQDVQAWRNLGSMNNTICALARMALQGFPLNSNHSQLIRDYVMSFANKKPTKKVAAVVSNKPTIQDRIRAQVSTVLAELDGKMDDAFDGDIPASDDMVGFILTKNLKGPQLKLIQQHLRKNLAEWYAAYNGEDEQLVEGYAYVGKRNFKKIIDTFSAVMDNISQQQTQVKSLRIRKKKPYGQEEDGQQDSFQGGT